MKNRKVINEQDGNNVLIRAPKLSDAPKLLSFINDLSAEKTYVLAQGRKYSKKEEIEYIKKCNNLAKNKQGVYLILLKDNKIIGCAGISCRKESVHSHVADFSISISREHRGKGYGKKLMTTIHDVAIASLPGIRMFCLSVFGNNQIAIKLYKDFGYKIYGRLPKAIYHNTEYHDGIDMYKLVK